MPLTENQIREMHEAFTAFKDAHKTLETEVKKYGDGLGESKAAVEKLNSKLDQIEEKANKIVAQDTRVAEMKSSLDRIASRLDEIETLAKHQGTPGAGKQTDGEKELKRTAFFKALKAGGPDRAERVLTEQEFKALNVAQDASGGYLVAPMEYVAEVLTNVVEFSNVRPLCRQRSTSAIGIQFPKRKTTAAASWVTEQGTRSETTNPAYGMEQFGTHEMYGMVPVTKQELEDAAFDIEGFLRAELSEQFGVTEGKSFVSGTGVGQCEGMLSNTEIEAVAGGHATLITADGLIELYYAPKEVYINNGTFVMSRSTLKEVRKLKDGTGQYLWAPGIKTDARPATILDRPYITAIDMPSITGNAYPVLFGDFRRGYMILDRVVLEFVVDPYTSKSKGQVEFSARRRVGGQVILAEAIKKLKIATSV